MIAKYGTDAATVFDLLGRNEVHLTAAVGWTLDQSTTLVETLAMHLGLRFTADDVAVALEVADEEGRTDIELTAGRTKVVVEAKQGWLIPGEQQLTKYVSRFDGFADRMLVSMSDSSERWAWDQLPTHLDGIPIRHISWDTVRDMVRTSRQKTHGRERLWLGELEDYMGKATSVRAPEDQRVYCVVISAKPFGGIPFKDYVLKERALLPSVRRQQRLAEDCSQLSLLPLGRNGATAST